MSEQSRWLKSDPITNRSTGACSIRKTRFVLSFVHRAQPMIFTPQLSHERHQTNKMHEDISQACSSGPDSHSSSWVRILLPLPLALRLAVLDPRSLKPP